MDKTSKGRNIDNPERMTHCEETVEDQKGARKMAKPLKTQERVKVQGVTIPPSSEVNAAFMQVGDDIQKRHIEAFNRLANR